MSALRRHSVRPPRQRLSGGARATDRYVFALLVLLFGAGLASGSPTTPTVEKLAFDAKRLPAAVRPTHAEGVVGGLHWRTAGHEGYLVLSKRDASRPDVDNPGDTLRGTVLYARLYALTGGKTQRLRQVMDRVTSCPVDITAEFLPKSFGITDLDHDGVPEVTFAYVLACRGGVDPARLKLLLLEGRNKYILRGQTSVRISAKDHIGGGYEVAGSFKRAPRAFLRHAKRLWKSVEREEP